MARSFEAATLLLGGNSPSKIAGLMGISTISVIQYLYTEIGRGTIRRSDIIFSLDDELKTAIEEIILASGRSDSSYVRRRASQRKFKLNREDVDIYLKFRDAKISRGDIYDYLYQIETTLHSSIKEVLVGVYGVGEGGWWRKGIPVEIRKDCVRSREEEAEPAAEPFCYTTIVHLEKIFDRQWAVLSGALPPKLGKEKRKFLSSLTRLNSIRNCVMHPVKGTPITESDFAFVRDLHMTLLKENWRPLSHD